MHHIYDAVFISMHLILLKECWFSFEDTVDCPRIFLSIFATCEQLLKIDPTRFHSTQSEDAKCRLGVKCKILIAIPDHFNKALEKSEFRIFMLNFLFWQKFPCVYVRVTSQEKSKVTVREILLKWRVQVMMWWFSENSGQSGAFK